MTLKKLLLWVLFAAMTPFVSSCDISNDAVSFHFVNLQITAAELPESFELYKTYDINVTYLRPNSCTFFEGFDIVKTATTERNVVAYGSEFEEAGCAQLTEEIVRTFSFTCYYDETYTFRFWTGEDENGDAQFLEYQVPVMPTSP